MENDKVIQSNNPIPATTAITNTSTVNPNNFNQNQSANGLNPKIGIAAAIAAFERSTNDKSTTSPSKAIVPSKKSLNANLKSSTSPNHTPPAHQSDQLDKNLLAKKIPKPPSPSIHTNLSSIKPSAHNNSTSSTNLHRPLVAKSGPRLSSTINRTSATTTTNTTTPTTNSNPRRSSVVNQAVNPTLKPLNKTTTTSTTRKIPPTNPTNLSNSKSNLARTSLTTSSTILKKTSTAPSKLTPLNNNQQTTELQTQLSQALSNLTEKSQQLSLFETKLEETKLEAEQTKLNLTTEIEKLNEKLQELEITSKDQTSESIPLIDSLKLDLATAQARVKELEENIELKQKDHSQLSNQQLDSLNQVSQLQESIDDLKKSLHDAQTSKQTEIDSLSAQHSLQLSNKLNELQLEYEKEKEALNLRLQESELELKESQTNFTAQLESKLENEIQQLKQDHSHQLEQLINSHSSQINQLQLDHESEIKSLKETCQSDLAIERQKLKSIEESFNLETQNLNQAHAHQLEISIQNAQDQLTQAHELTLTSLKAEHNTAITQLESDLEDIKQINIKLDQDKNNLISEIETLKAEKQAVEDRLSSEVIALKNEHAIQMQKEYQRAKDELNLEHIEQLKTIRQNSQETTDQLLSAHKAELETVKAALLSDFTSEKSSIEAELVQLKLELNALHSDLSLTRSTNQDQLETIDRLKNEINLVNLALQDAQSKSSQLVDRQQLENLENSLAEIKDQTAQEKIQLLQNQQDLKVEFDHARERHENEIKQHIEEKTLLQQELNQLKQKVESDAETIGCNKALISDLSQSIESEVKKRMDVEEQLTKQIGHSQDDKGSIDQKMTELHQAHNAKTLELENEIEKWKSLTRQQEDKSEKYGDEILQLNDEIKKWKDLASKSQEEAEEIEFKLRMLESEVKKENDSNQESLSKPNKLKQNLESVNNQVVEFAAAQI
ncbi:hypothetical protein O181_039501, partial [Austropuccinia psidii MF-1]|nr:hypothetical protein [Austropuccinia psidii MF-1]